LETSPVRVLVIEDYEPFRRFVCSTLGKKPELQIVGEVSDGLEAVQKAVELQADLIVLDIGLPSLNGIEVARRVRKLSAESKILFVSQESSADVVQEALGTGAHGYVVKTDAGSELPVAVNAVLRGEQFVGRRFSGHDFVGASDTGASHEFRTKSAFAPLHQNTEIAHQWRPSHTAKAFFQGCRHMAWILAPLLSREDTSRWMLLTRSRHSCSMACPIQFDS
jgi:DNA-binding NarL/FixJ family response regulator